MENEYEDDADFAFRNGEYNHEVDESDYMPVKKRRKMICECEDYPCCGHDPEQGRMTQEEWDAMISRQVRQTMEDEF